MNVEFYVKFVSQNLAEISKELQETRTKCEEYLRNSIHNPTGHLQIKGFASDGVIIGCSLCSYLGEVKLKKGYPYFGNVKRDHTEERCTQNIAEAARAKELQEKRERPATCAGLNTYAQVLMFVFVLGLSAELFACAFLLHCRA